MHVVGFFDEKIIEKFLFGLFCAPLLSVDGRVKEEL
jgi:hypothetical protein